MGYIGVIIHLLTIDPNFLGHPSSTPLTLTNQTICTCSTSSRTICFSMFSLWFWLNFESATVVSPCQFFGERKTSQSCKKLGEVVKTPFLTFCNTCSGASAFFLPQVVWNRNPRQITPPKTKMTLEKQLFEDVSPIKHVILLCNLSSGG